MESAGTLSAALRGPVASSAASLPTKPSTTLVVLDAGEGCCVQLYQACSGSEIDFHSALNRISLIWISHHHADHHCGLPGLLQRILIADEERKARLKLIVKKNDTQQKRNSDMCDARNLYAGAVVAGANNNIADKSCTFEPPIVSPRKKVLVIAPPEVIKYQEYFAAVSGLDEIVDFVPIAQTDAAKWGHFIPKMPVQIRSNSSESYVRVGKPPPRPPLPLPLPLIWPGNQFFSPTPTLPCSFQLGAQENQPFTLPFRANPPPGPPPPYSAIGPPANRPPPLELLPITTTTSSSINSSSNSNSNNSSHF